MADDASISTLPQAERVERPLHLIPVGLKEAALDSPTFRATALHFADQIEIVERWFEGYVKAASKLVAEVNSLESLVNSFLSQSMPPVQVSEAVLDHDYTMLAMQRYGEGAREFWQSTLRGVKRSDSTVIDPIKHFLSTELRAFKESRNALQATQKSFDHVIARYLSQSKTKEASSLREDAFQVHEARRAYIKASMDFCTGAPQVRASLDKLIVRIFSDQWKDMRASREANNGIFAKLSSEMERVRGWSSEMDNSERAFKRELLTARRQIEDSVSSRIRPSRELEDYSASTVPYLGSGAGGATGITSKSANERLEQQGWLFMKTTTGKPARTVWSRRWVFVKSGIFGWLIQGAKSGGVEESEKIGVLLCSIRPAFQEDRRFCFEIKTKDTSIILQAETQDELTEWISALEVAKKKALEDPTSTETSPLSSGVDPAFAVSSPVAPEFAAKLGDSQPDEARESEASVGMSSLASRSSFDTAAPPPLSTNRRVMSLEKQEGEGTREHAARIMSRFDLYKRGGASPRVPSEASTGGIASLISASHNILPVGPGAPPSSQGSDSIHPPKRSNTIPTSSLAPSTLANPPAPTNLSHTAVIVSGERGVGIGRAAEGMPSGIMANLWGSSNWGYVNRLGEDVARRQLSSSRNASSGVEGNSRSPSVSRDDSSIMDGTGTVQSPAAPELPKHRKTLSAANDTTSLSAMKLGDDSEDFPNYYPLPLKVQQAQFRMLFPSVPRSEQVVLVFRATWNANEQQEFPGRVYVTTQEVYFYSNHLGLVLITGASLSSINEVTSAPGRDCDFLFLLLKENREDTDQRRITIKVFLEPLRLLQRRLSYLVRNANSEDPDSLEEVLKVLIKLEADVPQRSSSVESWEDITYEGGSPTTAGDQQKSPRRYGKNVKASLRIDGNLYGDPARTGREVQKFKLPAQPVVYAPQGMQASVTRDFNVSAKALFHVMFGDKSAVFQLLYANRWADKISQSPWSKPAEAKGPWTRKFTSQDQDSPMSDTQTVDVSNDHLCYVVTNNKNPWRLPYATRFGLVTKIVITHTSKSKCKLAIFQQVNWLQAPQWSYIKHLIEKQALNSLEADALDLTNVAMDQVAKLGNHSKTNRAIEIFGGIGQQLQVPQIDVSAVPNVARSIAANGARPQETTGLPRLVLDDVFAKTLQLVSMVIDILIAVGKGAVGVCTAHTFLVALLATSMIYNSWYGYRDSLLWYQERSAGKFMSRVGVTPDPVMGRSIYLRDLEELVMPADVNETLDAMAPSSSMAEAKTCRTTFSDMIAADDDSIATPQKHAARLHNTRDAIARYRHDLLIALRVVNRVENDVLKAEWEDWVRSEERKCAKVERMLQRGESGKKSSKSKLDVDAQLGEEFAEYCRSCRTEVAGLLNETRIM